MVLQVFSPKLTRAVLILFRWDLPPTNMEKTLSEMSQIWMMLVTGADFNKVSCHGLYFRKLFWIHSVKLATLRRYRMSKYSLLGPTPTHIVWDIPKLYTLFPLEYVSTGSGSWYVCANISIRTIAEKVPYMSRNVGSSVLLQKCLLWFSCWLAANVEVRARTYETFVNSTEKQGFWVYHT